MFQTMFIPREEYEASPWDVYEELPGGLRVAKHPLYVQLLFGDRETKHPSIPTPDEIVKHRLEELEKAYHAHNTHRYVFIHERPFRFAALLDARDFVCNVDARWFEVAGEVWVDCEGPGRNAQMWRDAVFGSSSINKYMLMDEEEFDEFSNIKEPVTIYRGADSKIHARRGLSWTTDRKRAIWFARRYSPKHPWLATATVKRNKIAAVFLRRGEKEIVVASTPRNVKLELV